MVPSKILIFHTAFIGDVVLALPVAQRLREANLRVQITFVAIPAAAAALENHPAVQEVIEYDKRGGESGLSSLLKLARQLRSVGFEAAVVPHRSLRSALICWLARIPRRIGFSTSAAPWLFTDVIAYDSGRHEIDRNLSLLQPFGILPRGTEHPILIPSDDDNRIVDRFLLLRESKNPAFRKGNLVGIAPGSVWNTKRWPREHFVRLGQMLTAEGYALALVGGKDDADLCAWIERFIGSNNVLNATGTLSVLQSTALLKRCSVLVTNDSAPVHLAAGVQTPVVALFGATSPRFGFAPRGAYDAVVQMEGLACKPCSIHGGEKCPTNTFVCMQNLRPELVYERVKRVIVGARQENP